MATYVVTFVIDIDLVTSIALVSTLAVDITHVVDTAHCLVVDITLVVDTVLATSLLVDIILNVLARTLGGCSVAYSRFKGLVAGTGSRCGVDG